MNINSVTLIGRVTNDVEDKVLGEGRYLSKFCVATNHKSKKGGDTPEFHNVIAFGNLARICKEYLRKGRLIFVQGRLKTNRWEDERHVLRTKTEIIASQMLLLDKHQALVNPSSSDEEVTEATIAVADLSLQRA